MCCSSWSESSKQSTIFSFPGIIYCHTIPLYNRRCNIWKVYDGYNCRIISKSYSYRRTKSTTFHRKCPEAFIMAVSIKKRYFMTTSPAQWSIKQVPFTSKIVGPILTAAFCYSCEKKSTNALPNALGFLHNSAQHIVNTFNSSGFFIVFRSCVRATLKNLMITFFFPIIFTTMFLQNFRTPYDFIASSVVVDANPKRLSQQN